MAVAGLSEVDVGIIGFVNGMGFAGYSHLVRKFPGQVSRRRLGRLCRQGYLRYDRIFCKVEGIYRATAAGVKAAGHFLRPLSTVNLGKYWHDWRLVDLALLLETTTGGVWVSERVLRRRLWAGGRRREPLPDGLLTWPDREVAVELELSPKAPWRREKILRAYTRSAYDEVWYVTGPGRTEKGLEPALAGLPFVRLARWEGGNLLWIGSSSN